MSKKFDQLGLVTDGWVQFKNSVNSGKGGFQTFSSIPQSAVTDLELDLDGKQPVFAGNTFTFIDDIVLDDTYANYTFLRATMTASGKSITLPADNLPGQPLIWENPATATYAYTLKAPVTNATICTLNPGDAVQLLVTLAVGGGNLIFTPVAPQPFFYSLNMGASLTANTQITVPGAQSIIATPQFNLLKIALENFTTNFNNLNPSRLIFVQNAFAIGNTNKLVISTYNYGVDLVTLPPGVGCYIQVTFSAAGSPNYRLIPIAGFTNTITGNAYTVATSDVLAVNEFTNASGCAVTVDPSGLGTLTTGKYIEYQNLGAGQVVFTGATPSITGTNKLNTNCSCTLRKTSTGLYLLEGNLTS